MSKIYFTFSIFFILIMSIAKSCYTIRNKNFKSVVMSSITKGYPVYISPQSHRVHVSLTPHAWDKENVAYEFQNLETGDSYLGTTQRSFAERMEEHEYNLNHPEQDRGQTKVYRVMRKALHKKQPVVARVLKEIPAAKNLSNIEKTLIAKRNPSMNSNKGGRSSKPPQKEELSEPLSTTTPQKTYGLTTKAGKISAELTPSAKKVTKGVAHIYRYKDVKTGKCYVGQTIQVPHKRYLKHISLANNPEKNGAQRPFYKAMRTRPQDFNVGVIAQVRRDEVDAAERELIRLKDSCTNGYNGTHGHRKKENKPA